MNSDVKKSKEYNFALRGIFAATLLIFMVMVSIGQKSSFGKTNLNVNQGVALKGFDPVAYFTEGKPIKGDTSSTYLWQGGKWFFSTRKNRDVFTANPEKYAPQYGGYCAYGASRSYKADTDPLAFTIVGDKLFLNYNIKVKEEWLKDTAHRIQLANEYWKTLK